jgi:hypothetical protein
MAMAWPADQEAEIEVFYLSSYSPAPNPDEHLNADVKDAVTRRVPARSKKQLGAQPSATCANCASRLLGSGNTSGTSPFAMRRDNFLWQGQ